MARYSVRKTPKRWVSYLKGFVLFSALLAVGFASYSYWLVQDMLSGIKAPPVTNEQGDIISTPSTVPLPDGPRTILIMGTDARKKKDEANNSRTDTMLVLRVDPQAKKAAALFIPRDTWVRVPGRGFMKINSAYTYGKGPLAKMTVEDLTGMTINYYLVVDWRAFRQFVEAIGGVKLYVPKRIYDPIHDFQLSEGCQDLNGYQALQYVRFRHDARGDLGRIERQQAFISALAEQATGFRIIPKIPRIMHIIGRNVLTDMPSGELFSLGNLLRQIPRNKIDMVMAPGELGRRDRQSVVIPDRESIRRIAARMEEGLPAEASGGELDGPRGTGSSATGSRSRGSSESGSRGSSESGGSTPSSKSRSTDCP